MASYLFLNYIIHRSLLRTTNRTIMKRIFTLLFALGLFSFVQAQPGNKDFRQTDHRNDQQTDIRMNDRGFDDDYDDYDDVYNGNRNPYNNGFKNGNKFAAERRLRIQIAQINQEYDHRIQHVSNNFYLFRYEKERQIHQLDHQRRFEINRAYAQFNNQFNKHDDHHDYGKKSKRRY